MFCGSSIDFVVLSFLNDYKNEDNLFLEGET